MVKQIPCIRFIVYIHNRECKLQISVSIVKNSRSGVKCFFTCRFLSIIKTIHYKENYFGCRVISSNFMLVDALHDTIALQFTECMVTLLIYTIKMSKPKLFDWKLCLVSEETAVFIPFITSRVTVTTKIPIHTWVGHPACALVTNWCSTPVRHLDRVTWHPPSVWITIEEQHWIITLILNKLFTVQRDTGETCQLRQTCSCVMNVTWVAASGFITFAIVHVRSALTIVTNDCHANALFVCHITEHCEWCQSSLAIWIDDVISVCTVSVFSYGRARFFGWGSYHHLSFYCC